jgi:hypothetical protein
MLQNVTARMMTLSTRENKLEINSTLEPLSMSPSSALNLSWVSDLSINGAADFPMIPSTNAMSLTTHPDGMMFSMSTISWF